MGHQLAILVPVLARPHRVAPLLDSIRTTTPGAETLFICDPSDLAEQQAIAREDGMFITHSGGYAQKIHAGIQQTDRTLIFTAADDLTFLPDWFEAARAQLGGGTQVVGVNDLLRRTRDHATHFLMTRAYAERPTIDGKPGPFFQGYSHWACDDELIATARHRGVYAYAPDAHVRHDHPMTDSAPDDETYRKGRRHARRDLRLLRRRERLWT